MQNITINTAYRTIQLSVSGEQKHISAFEKKALQKYADLHQASFELESAYKKWHASGMRKVAAFKMIEEIVAEIEKEIKAYGEIAGFGSEEMGPEEGRINLKPGELQRKVGPFKEQFDELYLDYKSFHESYTNLSNAEKEYNRLFTEFDKQYYNTIIYNWQNMQINSTVLDNDYTKFKTRLSRCTEMEQKTNDLYWELYNTWNMLVKRVNVVYERYNLIFKHINQWMQLHQSNGSDNAHLN